MINKLAWACPAIVDGKIFRFLITAKDSPQLAIVAYKAFIQLAQISYD